MITRPALISIKRLITRSVALSGILLAALPTLAEAPQPQSKAASVPKQTVSTSSNARPATINADAQPATKSAIPQEPAVQKFHVIRHGRLSSLRAYSTEGTNLDETRQLERHAFHMLAKNPARSIQIYTDLIGKSNIERAKKSIESPSPMLHAQGLEELFRLAQAYNCRGIAYGELLKESQAYDDFNHALEINPKFATCYTNRGILQSRANRFDDAIKDLSTALAINPNATDALKARARLYQKMGKAKAAQQDQQSLSDLIARIKVNPVSKSYIDFGALALKLDEKNVSDHPKESNFYIFRARAHYLLGNYNQAIKDTTTAVGLKPSVEALELRAESNVKLTNNEAALKDIEQAIKVGPVTPNLYDLLARIDWNLDRKPKALQDRALQIKLDPADAVALINLGNMNFVMEKYPEAVKAYTEALKHSGPYNRATLMGYRGFAYINLKKFDLALADANRAIQLDPNCASGYLVRGKCYNRMDKLKEAKLDLDRAAALSPNEPEGLRQQGELAAETGDFEQATAFVEIAHDLDYRATSGSKVPEIKQNEYVLTIKEYSKLIQADAKNKEALFNRAILYLCVNEPQRAAEDLKKFLVLSKWQGDASIQAALLMNFAYRQIGEEKKAQSILEICKSHLPARHSTVLKYMLGEIDVHQAQKVIKDRSEGTEVRTFIGLDLECKGQKDKAAAQYKWVAQNGDQTMDSFSLAISGLSRIENGLKHLAPGQLD